MAREYVGLTTGGLDDRPLPEPGLVRFRAAYHDDLGLVAELNGIVTPTAGYGAHEITARPGREGITGYTGREPLALRIPLLFDQWTERGSVEDDIRRLEVLAGLSSGDWRPPQIIIEGFGIPHSYTRAPQNRYVLSGDPEWDDDTRYRGTDGHRSYVPVIVTARKLELPDPLTAGQQEKKTGGHSAVYFTVPPHGAPRTLRGIASRRHVNWRTLRQLNPRLPGDPDRGLPSRTKVRVA